MTTVADAKDTASTAQIVASTERAFSARCAEIGIRDSFLEYFALDAIHFEPEPRLARPDLERESASTKARLIWEPKIIRVASSKQLAVSSGPYFLQSETGKQLFGYFLSIWKKQSSGDWKVAADIGVSGPEAKELPDDFQEYDEPSQPLELSELLAFEREQFGADTDLEVIYCSIVFPDTIFERTGLPLTSGEKSAAVFLAAQKGKRTKLAQANGEISGNLGFTYGTESGKESPLGYLRVWIRRQSRWWLLFDVTN